MRSTQEFMNKFRPYWLRIPESQRVRLYKFLTDPANLQNIGLWVSALTAGFISVGYAWLFRAADGIFRQLLQSHSSAWTFGATPVLFLLAWILVRRYAPEAAGSGIPQIMAANEMEYSGESLRRVDTLLSLRTAMIKVLSSLICVLGGGAIGREGPTLQISSSLFHFFGKKVRRFMPATNEQMWVVAGAAAGLASAFNTPLGGIVYAIEEMGIAHFHRVRTALISAVIISGLVAQWVLGSYLYLGFPQLQFIEFGFLPIALLTGLCTGLLGGLFGRILFFLIELRSGVQSDKKLAGIAIACGLFMAGLFMISPQSAGSGIEVITGFLFRGEKSGPLLIALRFFGTMITYLSGAAGGIFSPSLAIGATVGAWMTDLFNTQHPNLMVLLGMIGFLTGVTRTPFTAFILVLEMTDRHSAIFPMMMAALVAQWAAQRVDPHSFYEHVKRKWLVRA
jgi:H+/Cl- antiporter ClcA